MLSHSMLMSSSGGLLAKIVFDSAAKVANYSIRSGSPSVSFDATNGGMSISGSPAQNLVAYDGFGGFNRGVAFEASIKFISDSFTHKHFGFSCDSGASGVNCYRIANLDNNAMISKYIGSSETVFTKTKDNATSLSVGNSYIFSAEIMKGGLIRLLINGNLIAEVSNNDFAIVRPGFFVWGCGIVVKDLSVFAI